MDTSKEYIKMCYLAKEVQGLDDDSAYSFRGDYEEVKIDADYYNTWLPRQDQLQGMITNNLIGEKYFERTGYFYWSRMKHFLKMNDKEITKNWSMEQLWLALVMKEKYNKIWKDNQWINEGTSTMAK